MALQTIRVLAHPVAHVVVAALCRAHGFLGFQEVRNILRPQRFGLMEYQPGCQRVPGQQQRRRHGLFFGGVVLQAFLVKCLIHGVGTLHGAGHGEQSNELFSGVAVVGLEDPGGVMAVPDGLLSRFALDVDHTVQRAGAVILPGQGRLSAGNKAVGPGRRRHKAQGLIGSQFPGAGRQLVHVEVDPTSAVLRQLQLVDDHREGIQKPRHDLKACRRSLEGLVVPPADDRIRPYGRRQHLRDRFARCAVHAPEMHEKGQAAQWAHEGRGKGRRQYQSGGDAVLAAGLRLRLPDLIAATGMDCLEGVGEIRVAVKDHALHIGSEALLVPAHAGHALDFRDPVIVQIHHVRDVVYQSLGPLPGGDRDPDSGQGYDVLRVGYRVEVREYGLEKTAAAAAPPEREPHLHFARIDILKPLHGPNWMGTGYFVLSELLTHAVVVHQPVPGIQFHVLALDLGDVVRWRHGGGSCFTDGFSVLP